MTYRTLDVTREGALTWLTLNRPEALNALDTTMVDELRDFLDEARRRPRDARRRDPRRRARLLRRARSQGAARERRAACPRACACSGASASCRC